MMVHVGIRLGGEEEVEKFFEKKLHLTLIKVLESCTDYQSKKET